MISKLCHRDTSYPKLAATTGAAAVMWRSKRILLRLGGLKFYDTHAAHAGEKEVPDRWIVDLDLCQELVPTEHVCTYPAGAVKTTPYSRGYVV
jgi:hypothetical protein